MQMTPRGQSSRDEPSAHIIITWQMNAYLDVPRAVNTDK